MKKMLLLSMIFLSCSLTFSMHRKLKFAQQFNKQFKLLKLFNKNKNLFAFNGINSFSTNKNDLDKYILDNCLQLKLKKEKEYLNFLLKKKVDLEDQLPHTPNLPAFISFTIGAPTIALPASLCFMQCAIINIIPSSEVLTIFAEIGAGIGAFCALISWKVFTKIGIKKQLIEINKEIKDILKNKQDITSLDKNKSE